MSTKQRVLDALSHLNIKPDGDNKYRCDSPFRSGSNSNAFCLTIDDDEHGAYIDHVSGESGSLYELAQKLGVATPSRPTVASTKRAYTGMDDYARQHAVTKDTLIAWGWNHATHAGRVALSFTTENGTRYRYLDGANGKPIYRSEKGYKVCWYGLMEHDTVKTRLLAGMPLVLCNGEISTIAGQSHGLASICVTSGEKSKIPDELMTKLKAELFGWGVKPKIIIAMDCDDTGRNSARGLVHQLKREGFEAIAIDLGLGRGGDLADFCMLHEGESHARLAQCATLPDEKPTPTSSTYRIVDLNGLFDLPPIKWLIPRVLPKQGLMAVYGKSGTYKSFYALDMALTLATHSMVLYIAAEGQLGYKQRVQAWQSIRQEQATFFRLLLGTVDLYDSIALDALIEDVKRIKPVLIVIDTLAMVSGNANENDTRDMNRIVAGLKRLIAEGESAVMIVHHTGKAGDDERGSSAFRGAMDVMVKLTSENSGDIVKVECTKMKDASAFKDFYLKPKRIELGYDDELGERLESVVLERTQGEQVAINGLTDSQKQTLRAIVALEKRGATDSERTVTAIARLTGVSTGTISKRIDKFVKDGLVTKNGAVILPTPQAYLLIASIPSTASTTSSVFEDTEKQSILILDDMEARKHGSNQRGINLNHGHY